MKFKWLKILFLCIISVFCLAGCGEKSDLKDELNDIELSSTLPEVGETKYRYLSEADEAVYQQQEAACELYYEASWKTRPTDYLEKYDIKPERVAYYCNIRRTELNDEISRQLRNNVRQIIQSVEDCENIDAYLDRVVDDALNFYDYYAEYKYPEDDAEFEESTCKILKAFYERRNILAFSFMAKHKDDFIDVAIKRIVDNSNTRGSYSMYITENNAIVEALNAVYNGVSSENAQIITDATIKLVRKMLEDDNELDEASIDTLMQQLGEPTPTPLPTPEPTPEPTPVPTPEPAPIPTPIKTQKPQTQPPAPTRAPQATEEVYIFE